MLNDEMGLLDTAYLSSRRRAGRGSFGRKDLNTLCKSILAVAVVMVMSVMSVVFVTVTVDEIMIMD